MDFISFSITKPVTVIVGIILVILFGLIGLYSMPYQLSPTVIEPDITVTTNWTGATPYEIERDIIEEQEKVLKGISGLTEMESTSRNSRGEITLKFKIGTNVDDALLRVSNKLNEVPSYPANADKPIISATGASTNPIIWMVLKTLEGNPNHIDIYRTYYEDEIRQYLERVEGVADLFVGAGTEREMHVVVDPEKLAAHNLTIPGLIEVLEAENVSLSAGDLDVGRRQFRIRTLADFKSPEDIEAIVLKSTGQRRITLGEVGRAEFGYEKKAVCLLHNEEPGIVTGIKPEPGANTLEITNKVWEVVQGLNNGKLKEQGLKLNWIYDERPYINGAISLVQQNILIGGALAVIVLFTFLRSISSTVIVAMAIPMSIIGAFIFMSAFGRNLNVISLAGISFAVGMLVDNAIVVLENIDRHRKTLGKPPAQAAHDGAKEVWGAVLASTLTTVAVFLPVIFIQEEAGQLFKDIAIAVTCAVLISLFVSVSVIPMLAKQLFTFAEGRRARNNKPKSEKSGNNHGGALNRLGARLVGFVMSLVELTLKNRASRLTTILSLTLFAVLTTWVLFPKMEYLPQGNRNFLINVLIPPPGLSYEELKANGRYLFDQAEPFRNVDELNGLPGVREMFYVGHPNFNICGVMCTKEQRVSELIPTFNGLINSIPGVMGVSFQAGIFQSRLRGGRSIDVDLTGPDVAQISTAGGAMYGAISQAVPGSQIRPVPSLELSFPEVNLIPERDRVKAAGMTAEGLGVSLDVLMDGRKIGEFREEGKKKIDLVLKGSDKDIATPEELYQSLLVTPNGLSVPVSSLAHLQRTTGLTEIRHLERKRTITLQVTPPVEIALEEAMEAIESRAVPGVQATGLLKGIDVTLSGAADKLTTTRQVLQWNFLLAVVIIYLLMSSLFGNFLYPLVILFTVPLAGAGGFLGLTLENLLLFRSPLDILTMLGFVILIGVVVNNAILIVHQSLNNIRDHGMEHKQAVLEAVRTRLRPIYMSATTSIFGMMPLVVFPGPGSELYRGLGSVILGGLAMSTVFTVFVIPPLLMFFIGMEKGKAGE